MIKAILPIVFYLLIYDCLGQQGNETYVYKDTVITGLDTINLIHTKLKVRLFSKRDFSFEAGQGDTILYSLQKENNRRMKYRLIKPNAEEKEYRLDEDVKNSRLDTEAGAGNYILQLRNRSFRRNNVVIDLKKVKGWKRTEKVKVNPPAEDSVWVVINDTIPRVVIEGTYYIGAKKNIRMESKKVIEFEFVSDSVPAYWAYLVGFGKEYQSEIETLIDLKTQQPIGDPLVAYFMKQFSGFPYSQSKRARMNLSGPKVNKDFNTTAYDLNTGKRGVYKLSVVNKDEVVGEYVYLRVVAFDLVKKSEMKVPESELKKMK
ncbi:hypothetical protein JKA74_08790 [Marivirga sp. S37H4]|uniref:Uncharacterized protein n=1 Tax=Marivirga aurantiaca TaxID=2802615 RepID=A0A934WYB7_9BACT|nr:hypothetical protein [Marivirga aurantiaca]MBK6265132.1 hypothetical protein [Marivirga aurantiaca]